MSTSNSGVRTETDTMATTATAVDGVADSLTTELTNLVNRLSAVDWQGLGGTSFTTTREAVEAEMARLNVALRSIAEGVRTSGANYAVSDETMQQELQQVGASESTITSALLINPDV